MVKEKVREQHTEADGKFAISFFAHHESGQIVGAGRRVETSWFPSPPMAIINLKAAKQIGLTIPPNMLGRRIR